MEASNRISLQQRCASQIMTKKLNLDEALRKLARSQRVLVKNDHAKSTRVSPARRADANEEFSEPPSASTALCVVILIALALIDFFALKWL
jgi:hypothetical protein